MAASGALRQPTRGRRMFVGAVRILALLAIIVGISVILVPGLSRSVAFYAVAALFAVTTFVLLRPVPRTIEPPSQVTVLLPPAPPDPIVVVDEKKIEEAREEERARFGVEAARLAEKSADAMRRARQELATSEQARAALDRNVDELTQTMLGLRQQIAELQTASSQRVVQADTLIAQLNSELASIRNRAGELEGQLAKREVEWNDKLQRSVHELQRALENERGVRKEVEGLARELHKQVADSAAAQGDLHRGIDQERTARERIEKHATELASRLADREAERDSLRAKIAHLEEALSKREGEWLDATEAAKTEASALAHRVADLESQLAAGEAAKAEAGALASRVAELESHIAARETDWNTRLQNIVSGMAADHENDIGAAIEQREAAKAEARSLGKRVADLEAQMEVRDAEWKKALATMSKRAAELEAQLGDRDAQLADREAQWNDKLQNIVSGMATDHENDIGKAIEDRESAKAEARALANRVADLERQLAAQENAWGEKLQTIVSHLASDHEADIGKALEEKEEARAEARTLGMRVGSLQQQIERDRQMFVAAQEKWTSLRDTLTAQAESTKRELEALRAERQPFGPAPRLPTPEPFPSPFDSEHPADAQRARAEVLEFAEQAHAVLKRTSPGTIPIPSDPRRKLLLFVHHDPNVRTMWRDQLHRNGYDVVTAADGLEGLRIANAQRPDAVIADMQMPKMDGRELCRLLKSNDQTASTKVVLMTAGGMAADSTTDGFAPDGLVEKPVKFDALQSALSNVFATVQ